ncbi:MAG TPA: hypothetical protein VMZ26_17560 [Pyrinomonadaceae bacterium]|nr:hypothetical protein [Pyrinomonadaceae bacterium]
MTERPWRTGWGAVGPGSTKGLPTKDQIMWQRNIMALFEELVPVPSELDQDIKVPRRVPRRLKIEFS